MPHHDIWQRKRVCRTWNHRSRTGCGCFFSPIPIIHGSVVWMRTAMDYYDSISLRGWNWLRLLKNKCNGQSIDSIIDRAKYWVSEPLLRYSSEKRCATPNRRYVLHFEIESAVQMIQEFSNLSPMRCRHRWQIGYFDSGPKIQTGAPPTRMVTSAPSVNAEGVPNFV